MVRAGALFEPAGVPALSDEVVAVDPVKAGAATVPAGVPPDVAELTTLDPVNVGAEIVPAGVIVSEPPVVPTSAFAASVPMIVLPFSAATSDQPVAQPVRLKAISPDGIAAATAALAAAVAAVVAVLMAAPSLKSDTTLVPRWRMGALAPWPKPSVVATNIEMIVLTYGLTDLSTQISRVPAEIEDKLSTVEVSCSTTFVAEAVSLPATSGKAVLRFVALTAAFML